MNFRGARVVCDLGITIPQYAFFRSIPPVHVPWGKMHLWVSDGSFFVGLIGDKTVFVQMPYLTTDNVHLLEMVLRKFMNTSKHKHRLSQVLLAKTQSAIDACFY